MPDQEDMSNRSWVQIPVPPKDSFYEIFVLVYLFDHLGEEFVQYHERYVQPIN